MAQLNFNASNHEEMDDFSIVPAGEYNVQIVKSELKDTKDKTGKRLIFQFKILNGDYKGRILFTGLNIVNQNKTAEEISKKELTSICKACGKLEIQDTAELHNIPLTVKVKIKPASGNYDEQNQITKYMPYSGVDGAVSGASEANNTSSVSGDNVPWEE